MSSVLTQLPRRAVPALPGRDYHDPGVFELERERIFHRKWFCIGRAGQAPEPGGFFVVEVIDEPLSYGRYRMAELTVGHRIVYDVAANWKILIDNFNECLHCPGVHPELTTIVPLYRKGMVIEERDDGGTGVRLADAGEHLVRRQIPRLCAALPKFQHTAAAMHIGGYRTSSLEQRQLQNVNGRPAASPARSPNICPRRLHRLSGCLRTDRLLWREAGRVLRRSWDRERCGGAEAGIGRPPPVVF